MSQLKCNTVNVGGDTLTDGVIKHSTYGSPDVDTGNKITLKGDGTNLIEGDTDFTSTVHIKRVPIEAHLSGALINSTTNADLAGTVIFKIGGGAHSYTLGTMPPGTQLVIINCDNAGQGSQANPSDNITVSLQSTNMQFYIADGTGPTNADITISYNNGIATFTWMLDYKIYVTGVGIS